MNFSTHILKTGAIIVITSGTIIGSVLGGHKVADIISNRFYKKSESIETIENTDDNDNNDNDNNDNEAYEYKYIDDYQTLYDEVFLENKNQEEEPSHAETEEHEKYKSDLESKLNGTKIQRSTYKG